MSRPRRTRISVLGRALLGVVLGSVALSGCDFDVYKLPLPGGPDAGDDPMVVTVQFADVLDLVPRSTVKVNDVTVGEVTDIDLDGYTAEVRLKVRDDIDLPDNTLAQIRQTSLLGEKFVSLSAPAQGAGTGRLADGDLIPLDRSGRNPEVEEVLGALSLLLNGGGVAQLKTINTELNLALGGREDAARSVLTQIDELTGTLDANKADIVQAIESLNRLALSVNEQLPTIDSALAELPSALTSIDAQRADLVKMLQALDQLGDVGVRVIGASKADTIASLKKLQPVLTQLAASGDAFVNAFNVFYAYPFVDEAVGRDPQVARNLHMGDYTNLSVELDVDLTKLADLPGDLPVDLPGQVVDGVQACLATANPASPECTRLIGNQLLADYCNDPANRNGAFCTTIKPLTVGLPSAPTLPGIGGTTRGGGGGGTGGTRTPTTAPSPTSPSPSSPPLGGLPVVGQLFRSATGPWAAPAADGRGGPTVAQLRERYDPDLVSLLVPGMVSR